MHTNSHAAWVLHIAIGNTGTIESIQACPVYTRRLPTLTPIQVPTTPCTTSVKTVRFISTH